jgi:hypothetical protein
MKIGTSMAMRCLITAASVFFLLCTMSCSDDNDGGDWCDPRLGTACDGAGGSPPSKASPKTKCEAFVDKYCGIAIACGDVRNQTQCLAALRLAGLDCDHVVSVGPQYDNCMNGMNSMKCSDSDIPAVCRGLIKME